MVFEHFNCWYSSLPAFVGEFEHFLVFCFEMFEFYLEQMVSVASITSWSSKIDYWYLSFCPQQSTYSSDSSCPVPNQTQHPP